MKSKYFAVVRDHNLCICTPVYSEILVCDYYYKYYISAFFNIPIFFFTFFFHRVWNCSLNCISYLSLYSCLITSAIFHSLLNEVHSLLVLWCCFPPAGFLKCPFWCYLFVLSACGINSLLLIHLSLSLSPFFFRLLFSPLFLCMFFLYSVLYSEEPLLVGSFSSLLSPILSITDSRQVLKMLNISRCEVIML